MKNVTPLLTFTIENKHWDKRHAYLHLHTNSAELSLGTSADIDFQNFYLTETPTNTGLQ